MPRLQISGFPLRTWTEAEGNDTIAIRSMQHFCLGFDHRTIDGADAGKFMGEFKRALEEWDKEIG